MLMWAQLSGVCFSVLSTPALGQLQAGVVPSGSPRVSSPSNFLAFFYKVQVSPSDLLAFFIR